MATRNHYLLTSESVSDATVDNYLASDAIRDIGYEQAGFHWQRADVEIHVHAERCDLVADLEAELGAAA